MNAPDLLATLRSVVGELPPSTPPRHPATGCPCTSCTSRDEHLETLAERRADARKGH